MGRDEALRPNSRPVLDEFRPGHVFWLPPGSTWMNDDKPRPFALATQCGPGVRGTLVYGSTRETEKNAGAACIEVPPRPHGLNRNGLRANTFFYPGVLLRTAYGELPAHAGFLGGYRGELRAALRIALGIGQGSCSSPGAPAGSRRGRIVELTPELARDLRTRFAVLLTEQEYSRTTNYHVILPIYPGDGRPMGRDMLSIAGREWRSPARGRRGSFAGAGHAIRLVRGRHRPRDGARGGRGFAGADRSRAVRLLRASRSAGRVSSRGSRDWPGICYAS
jgi:hypothetical protein